MPITKSALIKRFKTDPAVPFDHIDIALIHRLKGCDEIGEYDEEFQAVVITKAASEAFIKHGHALQFKQMYFSIRELSVIQAALSSDLTLWVKPKSKIDPSKGIYWDELLKEFSNER